MALKESLSIMVVDDMATSRGLIIMALEEMGIKKIDFRTDGADALRSLVAKPVHLVISDYNMPKLDGLGLLRAIRSHAPTSKTAFIMLTGRADSDLVKRAAQFGVNNYLVKPFTVQGLRGKIEQVFGALT